MPSRSRTASDTSLLAFWTYFPWPKVGCNLGKSTYLSLILDFSDGALLPPVNIGLRGYVGIHEAGLRAGLKAHLQVRAVPERVPLVLLVRPISHAVQAELHWTLSQNVRSAFNFNCIDVNHMRFSVVDSKLGRRIRR